GRSERELRIAADELRAKHKSGAKHYIANGKALAEFLMSFEGRLKTQRQREQDRERERASQTVHGEESQDWVDDDGGDDDEFELPVVGQDGEPSAADVSPAPGSSRRELVGSGSLGQQRQAPINERF